MCTCTSFTHSFFGSHFIHVRVVVNLEPGNIGYKQEYTLETSHVHKKVSTNPDC